MNTLKRCPNCGRKYEGLKRYCSKCGYKLESIPNVCSQMKTTMCEHLVLEEDDMFCPYCGSPSTNSLEKRK